ncbi:MAG: hypothetical protein Q9187_006906 [Circinaria calcarea]
MQHIPPTSLPSLPPRLSYTLSFLDFCPDIDGPAINASASLLGPLMPTVLDLVYTKLLSYDITAKAFVPPLEPAESTPSKPQTPQELHLNHAHILRQKTFLKAYLLRIAKNEDWSPQSPLWGYMDRVAVAHTGVHREKKPDLRVEFMHLALLLGFVEDVLLGAVMGAEQLDAETKSKVLRAWNKVLWVQNDLFARHYVVDRETGERPAGMEVTKDSSQKLKAWGIQVLVTLLVVVLVVRVLGYLG